MQVCEATNLNARHKVSGVTLCALSQMVVYP